MLSKATPRRFRHESTCSELPISAYQTCHRDSMDLAALHRFPILTSRHFPLILAREFPFVLSRRLSSLYWLALTTTSPSPAGKSRFAKRRSLTNQARGFNRYRKVHLPRWVPRIFKVLQ